MGTSFTFTCSECGYEARVSGGADCGEAAATETMVCKRCRSLVDVVVDVEFHRVKHPHCPECRSDDLVKWDARRKPCPRCPGRMTKGDIAVFWD